MLKKNVTYFSLNSLERKNKFPVLADFKISFNYNLATSWNLINILSLGTATVRWPESVAPSLATSSITCNLFMNPVISRNLLMAPPPFNLINMKLYRGYAPFLTGSSTGLEITFVKIWYRVSYHLGLCELSFKIM